MPSRRAILGPVPALAACVAVLAVAPSALARTPEEDFQAAENHFRFQDYKAAESILVGLLYPEIRLANPDQVLKAREYLGACYFWLQEDRRLEEEFTALLTRAPSYKLDPFYYPAPLLARFDALRKRLVELHVISLEPAVRPEGPPPKCERQEERIVRRSKAVAYLPFGIGQFQNGKPLKGGLFLGGQALMLGTNIGAYVAAERLRGSDGLYTPANASRARALRYVQYGALGAFAALAIWGIVDSALDFVEEERTVRVVPCPPPPAMRDGPGTSPAGPVPLSFCVEY